MTKSLDRIRIQMSSMTATDLEDCSQWSEGLVSAAHLVVAATHSLCDAANLMVQGQGNEEKLISAAKQVRGMARRWRFGGRG